MVREKTFEPRLPTLTRPFSNNPASADSRLGTKKCFVLFCPMDEQGLLFSFRVFVHDGCYLAILVRFFHQGWACKGNLGFSYFVLTRNVGTTDDLGRRFRCYQEDRSNLLLDHSVTSRVQRKSVLQPAIRASCR